VSFAKNWSCSLCGFLRDKRNWSESLGVVLGVGIVGSSTVAREISASASLSISTSKDSPSYVVVIWVMSRRWYGIRTLVPWSLN
jgi:hypothetical protein